MALKRTSDSMVAYPDLKRSRNELVAITNRDKALLEAVSRLIILNVTAKSKFSMKNYENECN